MLVRLGNVIYWLGCAIAVILFIVAIFGAFAANESSANRITIAVLSALAGLAAWVIGRACKYVLAGG